ncbi:hypothetical protein SAMN05216404_11931 [Nitrosospira multiformis]|uniref:Uncharacterized protein n=1 Tax=Nitrosospira multiformis TaxID=1231 RepID=A0A1H8P6B9_9PROT|nr:hypothetical protein [Nitrosospira multiformis]SEO37489.1 hypothetical protein SAMN05216404_11931 [Nitrosospira multiformis]
MKTNMVHSDTQLHASCSSCGALFRSKRVRIAGNTKGIAFLNNKETCLFCGALADIQEGTFDMVNGVLRMVRDATLTRQMCSRLESLAIKAYTEKIPTENLLREIKEISPSLGQQFPKMPIYTFLLVLVAASRSCTFSFENKLEIKLDANQLVSQIQDRDPASIIYSKIK